MKFILRFLHKLNRLRCFITRPLTVGVRILLVREDQVLLVKHAYEPYWYIPGGGVKKGETLEQAIRREAFEETGATLGELHLFGVYTNFYEYKSDHVIVFACEDFDVRGRKNIEIETMTWFPIHNLPDAMSLGSKHRIEEYAQGLMEPIIGKW